MVSNVVLRRNYKTSDVVVYVDSQRSLWFGVDELVRLFRLLSVIRHNLIDSNILWALIPNRDKSWWNQFERRPQNETFESNKFFVNLLGLGEIVKYVQDKGNPANPELGLVTNWLLGDLITDIQREIYAKRPCPFPPGPPFPPPPFPPGTFPPPPPFPPGDMVSLDTVNNNILNVLNQMQNSREPAIYSIVVGLQSQLASIITTLDVLNQLNAKQDSIITTLSLIQSNQATDSTAIAALTTALSDVNDNITSNRTAITSLGTQLTSLASQLGDVSSSVSSLRVQVGQLATQVANIASSVTDNTTSLSDLTTLINAVTTTLATLTNTLDEVLTAVTALAT